MDGTSTRWQTPSPADSQGGSRARHPEPLQRVVAEAASAVIYIFVGLVVLIVFLVISNARRSGPEARGTGSNAGDGGVGDGGGSG